MNIGNMIWGNAEETLLGIHVDKKLFWQSREYTLWQSREYALWQSHEYTLWQSREYTLWQSSEYTLWQSREHTLWQSREHTLWQSREHTLWQSREYTLWQSREYTLSKSKWQTYGFRQTIFSFYKMKILMASFFYSRFTCPLIWMFCSRRSKERSLRILYKGWFL